MKTFRRMMGFSKSQWGVKVSLSLFSLAVLIATGVQAGSALQGAPPSQQASPRAPAPPYTQGTPEQLQQLVAPIALYPDSLVAQILAASTFPEQIVEADRWVQEHPGLKGEALGQAVDQQPWDPSVKALTAFPSVLGNMDKNLTWTSSLGDAYYNQQQDVMDAVQAMRQRAQEAGNLKTTPQQTVTTKVHNRHPARRPAGRLRPRIRPVDGLRRTHRSLAGMVPVSRDLVWRPVSRFWTRLRHRLLRGFWMGLGPLGIRLARPIRDLWRRPVLLPQQHLL